MKNDNLDNLIEASLELAKFWGQPLSEIEAMDMHEFREAQRIANEAVQDAKKQQSAPPGGRVTRIT